MMDTKSRTVSRKGIIVGRVWLLRAMAGLFGLLLALPTGEVMLRLLREPDRFYPYHRNAKRVFYPSEETTPGIEGVSYFTTNSLGTRGSDPNSSRYRLLVVGGSTAACTALNDDEAWPFLLGHYVNERLRDAQTLWVTNSGIDGRNSYHHIMHAKYLVPRIADLDYVLVYAGLNDVGRWLYATEFDARYLDSPANWARTVDESFRICTFTSPDAPWYKHFEIWKTGSIVRSAFRTRQITKQQQDDPFVQDERFEWLESAARDRADHRKEFVHRAKMETLSKALESYRSNLTTIIRYCRASNAEPILMAQYMKWYALTEKERRRIWMGAMDGGEAYVRAEQMNELIAQFNLSMKEVASRENVLFVDLPSLLGGHDDLCYDGCHFNEKGSRMTAQRIAELLIDKDLFRVR